MWEEKKKKNLSIFSYGGTSKIFQQSWAAQFRELKQFFNENKFALTTKESNNIEVKIFFFILQQLSSLNIYKFQIKYFNFKSR